MPTKSPVRPVASAPIRSTAPLTLVQLELLKLFERPLTAQQVEEIKTLLTKYLAHQVDQIGSQVWHDKGLTNEDMDNLLELHVRTGPGRKNE